MATPKYNVQLVLLDADDKNPNNWEWKFKFPFFDAHFPNFTIDFNSSVVWQMAIRLPVPSDDLKVDVSYLKSICQLVCDCASIQIVFTRGTYAHVSHELVGSLVEIVNSFERIFCDFQVDNFIVQAEREVAPRISVELFLG